MELSEFDSEVFVKNQLEDLSFAAFQVNDLRHPLLRLIINAEAALFGIADDEKIFVVNVNDIAVINPREIAGVSENTRLPPQIFHGIMVLQAGQDMGGKAAPVNHVSSHNPGGKILTVSGQGIGDRSKEKLLGFGDSAFTGDHRAEIPHAPDFKKGLADGLALGHMGGAIDGFPLDAGGDQDLHASLEDLFGAANALGMIHFPNPAFGVEIGRRFGIDMQQTD